MDQPDDVVFYLERGLLRSAREGRHNFIGLVSKCLSDAGLRVFFEPAGPDAARISAARPGYSIFHMDDPGHDRALTLRRNYFYPFWQIERSARRWEWRVAAQRFPAIDTDRDEVDRFVRFWRRKLFPAASEAPGGRGPIFVPLQGRITEHRSFQSCSPVAMIERTATRLADRDILVTLHPKETYDDADFAVLEAIEARHRNVAVSARPVETILPGCAGVVTQNSAVALEGFFFGKPAVLFGQIDFHHIAGNVPRDGEDAAFAALDATPDYAGYLWWFLQHMSINAGRPEAPAKIASVLRGHGWPV